MEESRNIRWKVLLLGALCSLSLAEPPSLATAPTAESFSSSGVTISWPAWDENSDYGTGPVASCAVKVRNSTDVGYSLTVEAGLTRLVTVQPLMPEKEYAIAVECQDSDGNEGGAGPELTVTIPCGAPSEPPTAVELDTVNTTALRLTWAAPPQSSWGCSNLDDVVVVYKYRREMEDFPSMFENPQVSVNSGELIIGVLEPCTSYDVLVSLYASTAEEYAESNVVINGTTELAAVGPVTNPNGIAQPDLGAILILTWGVPDRCPPDSYTVSYALTSRLACPDEEVIPEIMEVTDIQQISYVLSGLEHFSEYELNVTGVNDLGPGEAVTFSARTARSIPASAPVPMLREDLAVPGELHFNWTAVPCPDLQGTFRRYLGERYKDSTREEYFQNGKIDWREGSFSGLPGCTEYGFRIRVTNAAGPGEFSDMIMVTTPTTAPGVVKDLSSMVLPDVQTSFNITWSADDMEPCQAVSYTVEYGLSTLDQCEEANSSVPMTVGPLVMVPDTSFLIEGLEPYSTYQVAVYASNDGGNSSRVEKMVNTGEQAPTGTPSEVMASMVEYNWMEFTFLGPPCGTRRGRITQYHYELRNTNTGEVTNGTTTTMTVTLENLERNTDYGIKIRAENSAGVGDYSEEVVQATAEGLPTMPLGVSTYERPSAALPLTWSAPAKPNGMIQYYEVEVRNMDKVMMFNVTDVAAMPLRLLVAEVEPNMEYSVMVRAINEAGPSFWSDSLKVVILEGAPSPVVDLMVEDNSEDSITVSWSPPVEPKGVVSKYTVEYSIGERPYLHEEGPGVTKFFEVKPEDTSLELVDLEPATEYVITVWAHTSEEQGESATIRQFTLAPDEVPAPADVVLLTSSVGDDGLLVIKLPPTSFKYATHYQIGVHCQDLDLEPLFFNYSSSECSYITGEVPNMEKEQEFIIGDGKTYGSYVNKPLDKERKYDIYVSLVSRTKESSSVSWGAEPLIAEDKSPLLVLLWIFIIILLIVLIIILLLCVVSYCRKRQEKKKPPSSPEENVPLE